MRHLTKKWLMKLSYETRSHRMQHELHFKSDFYRLLQIFVAVSGVRVQYIIVTVC